MGCRVIAGDLVSAPVLTEQLPAQHTATSGFGLFVTDDDADTLIHTEGHAHI